MEPLKDNPITISFTFENQSFQITVIAGISFFDLRDRIAKEIKINAKFITLNAVGQVLKGDLKKIKFNKNQQFDVQRKKDSPINEQKTFEYIYNERQNQISLPQSELSSNNLKFAISQIEKVPKHSIQLFNKKTNQELPKLLSGDYVKDLEVIIVKDDPDFKKNPQPVDKKEIVKEEFKNPPEKVNSYHPQKPHYTQNQNHSNPEKLYFKVKYGNEQKTINVRNDGLVRDLIKLTKMVFKIPKEKFIHILDKDMHQINSHDYLNKLPKDSIYTATYMDKNKKFISIKIETPDNKIIEITINELRNVINLKKKISYQIHYSPFEFDLYNQSDKMIDIQTSLKGFHQALLKIKFLNTNNSAITPSSNPSIYQNILNPTISSQSNSIKQFFDFIKNMQLNEESKAEANSTPTLNTNPLPELSKLTIKSPSTPIETFKSKEEKLKEINAKIEEMNKILENNLSCPICHDIFKDPVLAKDGIAYCRSCINGWFVHNNTSPFTRENLTSKEVTPIQLLKSQIIDFKKNLELIEKLKEDLSKT